MFVANGVEHHMQVLGEGPLVVMLHGLLVDNMASWYFTAAPEVARDHRVLLYDLRGHGRSERVPSGYKVAELAGDLEVIIAEDQAGCASSSGAGPVDLVGHSYGALVALHYALEHPGLVRRLVLVEAPLPPSSLAEMSALAGTSPEALLAKLPAGMQAGFLAGNRRARRLVESLGFLLAESSLVADLKSEEDLPDAALRGLQVPVLAVYGRDSSCRGVGERLEREIPDCTRVELDGGHYLPLDQPFELARIIRGFLDG